MRPGDLPIEREDPCSVFVTLDLTHHPLWGGPLGGEAGPTVTRCSDRVVGRDDSCVR